jgi:hypothetical protein
MSSAGAAPRAAVSVSNARAEASRKNGAKSRGPKTLQGKARSAQNALKHGLRAQKYVVLPEENAGEFAGLEAALVEELAPVGTLQLMLARRVAVAAWRLARADRIEADLFAERSWGAPTPTPALPSSATATAPAASRRLAEVSTDLVVGALRPTATAARRWPSSGAPSRRSRPSRPSRPLTSSGRQLGMPQPSGSLPAGAHRGAPDAGAPCVAGQTERTRAAGATGRTRARRRAPTGLPAKRAGRGRPNSA